VALRPSRKPISPSVLAYITGTVDQELLLRNEYLAAENRILMAKLNGRPRFSDVERATPVHSINVPSAPS
jgi:hypothetical protein